VVFVVKQSDMPQQTYTSLRLYTGKNLSAGAVLNAVKELQVTSNWETEYTTTRMIIQAVSKTQTKRLPLSSLLPLAYCPSAIPKVIVMFESESLTLPRSRFPPHINDLQSESGTDDQAVY